MPARETASRAAVARGGEKKAPRRCALSGWAAEAVACWSLCRCSAARDVGRSEGIAQAVGNSDSSAGCRHVAAERVLLLRCVVPAEGVEGRGGCVRYSGYEVVGDHLHAGHLLGREPRCCCCWRAAVTSSRQAMQVSRPPLSRTVHMTEAGPPPWRKQAEQYSGGMKV